MIFSIIIKYDIIYKRKDMVNVMNYYSYERDKKEKEYQELKLRYEVKDVDWAKIDNKENLEPLINIFNEIGVIFELKDNKLTIGINGYNFLRKQNRYAGRHEVHSMKSSDTYEFYRFSDIMYMLNTKTDKEIAEIIGMKIATYYRHKKKMKNSNYYKKLNLDKLQDKKYLESQKGNFIF